MANKTAHFIRRRRIPKHKGTGDGFGLGERKAIRRSQGQSASIGTERDAGELQIAVECSYLAAAGQIPELGGPVQTARRQPAAVRTEGE